MALLSVIDNLMGGGAGYTMNVDSGTRERGPPPRGLGLGIKKKYLLYGKSNSHPAMIFSLSVSHTRPWARAISCCIESAHGKCVVKMALTGDRNTWQDMAQHLLVTTWYIL